MYDQSGVIEENLKPVKLSEFRLQYAEAINYFEKTLEGVGAEIINLTDNWCW